MSNIITTWFILALLPNGVDSYLFQKPAFESKLKCVEFIVEKHEILNGFVAEEYNLRYNFDNELIQSPCSNVFL